MNMTSKQPCKGLIYSTHDAHIVLHAGALDVFTFGSPLRIVSVSSNGIELLRVFVLDDLVEAGGHAVTWKPSAIVSIDGMVTTQFLTQFAALNAHGTLEPYADWNQLMASAAGDIQGILSAFEGSTPFYPGENISFTYENGTKYDLPWLVTYNLLDYTPTISSGQDFYDWFVLGIDPTSDSSSSSVSAAVTSSAAPADSGTYPSAAASSSSMTSEPMPTSWEYFPYPPDPVVVQPNLGSGGVVSGYFLNDGVTAVLSIPSFAMNTETVLTFSETVGDFISRAKSAGKSKIIIDVQRNGGGGYLLATDTFKHFFPSIDPFDGSRLRAHGTADALGNTFTNYYDTRPMDEDLYSFMSADVWTATTYLNAVTNRNITSWGEYYGPHLHNGDYFTTTQRDNFSSIIFDVEASGGTVVYGFANRSATPPQPYDASDIVILSDAYCHSACAVFLELMHHQGGVRTVVAGGRPELSPMQSPGGSRGAQAYSVLDLDQDIQIGVEKLNKSLAGSLPNRNFAMALTYAGINLKDQIRKEETVPLQFVYEVADCRIFFTTWTIYNYMNLWNYVVDAIWRNPSLCVHGSNKAPSPGKATDTLGPAPNPRKDWEATIPNISGSTADISAASRYDANNAQDIQESNNAVDDQVIPSSSNCDCICQGGDKICLNGYKCWNQNFCVGHERKTRKACQQPCIVRKKIDPCRFGTLCSKQNGVQGVCQKPKDAIALSKQCPPPPTTTQSPAQAASGAASGVPNQQYQPALAGQKVPNSGTYGDPGIGSYVARGMAGSF